MSSDEPPPRSLQVVDESDQSQNSQALQDKRNNNQTTSFIHKLYAMLEDQSLNHVIWWHANQSSFYVCPTEEFSKVLSTYFKHANIASFIRQLNMYGFHKVNDSYNNETSAPQNTGKPETSNQSTPENDSISTSNNVPKSRKGSTSSSNGGNQVWEFKHSSGWFKHGNIEGLNQIKRRSFKNVASQKEVHNLKTSLSQTYSADSMPSAVAPPGAIPPISVSKEMENPPNSNNNNSDNNNTSTSPSAANNYNGHSSLGSNMKEVQNYTPYRYTYQANSPNDLNDNQSQEEMEMKARLTNSYLQQQMISSLQQQKDTKIVELQTKYNDLLKANDSLNYKYEIIKDDLTKTNYDCVSMLDLFKDLLNVITPAMKQQQSDHSSDPTTMRIYQELDKFKSNILQRSAARDMALKQATQSPGYYADLSYQHNPSMGSVIVNGPMNQNQSSFSQGQPLHPQPQPQPQQQSQQPHYPPHHMSQSHNFSTSSFHDPPVLHKDIRYSTTSSRSRDLSVFDPLQPIPPQPLVAGGSIAMQQHTQSPHLQPQFHEQDQMYLQQQQDQIHAQQQIQMQQAPPPPPTAQQHHLQQQLPSQIQHQHQQPQHQMQRDSSLGLSLPPPTVHQHHPPPTSFPSSPNPVRKYTPNSPSTTQQMQQQNNLQSGHPQPQVIQSLSNQSMVTTQSMDTNKTRSSSANSLTYIGSNGQQPPQQSQTPLLPHSSSHQRLQQLQQPQPSQPSQPPSQQPQQSSEQQQPPSSQQSQQSSQLQQQSTVPGKRPTSITSQPTTPLEEKRLSTGQMYFLNNPPRSIPAQMGLTSLPHVSSIDQNPSTSQAQQQQPQQPNTSSTSPGARPGSSQQVTSYFNPQAPSEVLQPRTNSTTTSYNASLSGAGINGNSSNTQISSLVSGTVSNGNQQQQQASNGSLPPPPPAASHQLQGTSFQSQPTSNNTVYSLLNPNNEPSSSAVASAVSPSTKRGLEDNEISRPSVTSAAHSTSPVPSTGLYHQELKRTRLV